MKIVLYKHIVQFLMAVAIIALPNLTVYSQVPCVKTYKTYKSFSDDKRPTAIIMPGFGIIIDSVDGIQIPIPNALVERKGKTRAEVLSGIKTVVCHYDDSYFWDSSSIGHESRQVEGALIVSFDAIAGHVYEIVGYLSKYRPYPPDSGLGEREKAWLSANTTDSEYREYNEWYLRVRDLTDGGREILTKGIRDSGQENKLAAPRE